MALAYRVDRAGYDALDPVIRGHYKTSGNGWVLDLPEGYYCSEEPSGLQKALTAVQRELKEVNDQIAEVHAGRVRALAEFEPQLKRWGMRADDPDLKAKLDAKIAAAGAGPDDDPPKPANAPDEATRLKAELEAERTKNRQMQHEALLTSLCGAHRARAKVLMPFLIEATKLEVDEKTGAAALRVLDKDGQIRLDAAGAPLAPSVLMDEWRHLDPQLSRAGFEQAPPMTTRNGQGSH